MALQGQEPPRWWSELADIHLHGMRPELKRTMIRLYRGLSRPEIADHEGVEPSTVKGWIGTATAEIASHLSGKHPNPGELRGGWTVVHIACCLGDELQACA